MKGILLKLSLAATVSVFVVATGLSNQAARLGDHASTGTARAFNCPLDPDYAAAGSYNASFANECESQGVYAYTGSGSSFSILYYRKSQTGTQTKLGLFKIKDPKADPLIFTGTTVHNVAVVISVPRSSFDTGGTRVSNLSSPVDISISFTPDGKKFADTNGIAYGGAGASCPDVATPGLKSRINCSNKNPIYALLEYVLNWAIKLLLVLAVFAVVISGIQYITSQGNPDGLRQAKTRLTNAVVGIILLSLMFVILSFLNIVK